MQKSALSGVTGKIEKVLREELGSIGLDRVEFREGYDHDGEAAVFVTAVLPVKTPLVPGEISNAASLAVAHVIGDTGDDRFTYLMFRHPDDERPADERSEALP